MFGYATRRFGCGLQAGDVSDSERLYSHQPLRALRLRLHLITSVAAETRQHVLGSRDMLLARLDALGGKIDSLAGEVEDLAEARRGDRAWMSEALRVMHDREPERRRRLAELRIRDDYDALYELQEPLVSVVIPTFRNHALLAERAIPSVLAQTYQHFEVIVVGDGAPTAAAQAVAAFDDPRLSFHNLELRGPYPDEPERRWLVAGVPPYNEAVRRARGQWIAPLDDDDAFRPDHIEVLLQAAQSRRLELVYGGIAQHEPSGQCTRLGTFPPGRGQFNLQAAMYRADLGDLFDLELADELFDEPYDWALCQRMARSGVRIGMVDPIVVDYYPSSLWTRELDSTSDRDESGASAVEWSYAPAGWTEEHANGAGQGWDVENVAQMYAERWPAFIETLGGEDPLGATHVVGLGESIPRENLQSHNMVMVFAYALALSARMTGVLSILDWGGALGHYHALARALVPDLELDYHCKELPAVCDQGRLVSPEVTFHESETCLEQSYDLVLASGAIQYAADWTDLFTRLGRAARRYVLITKVPVTEAPSFVVLQRAYRYGYDTEYLGWALNRGEIRTAARTAGLELVREFFLSGTVDVSDAPGTIQHAGFLFKAERDAAQ